MVCSFLSAASPSSLILALSEADIPPEVVRVRLITIEA
jgi:hypothetical protein